MLIPDKKRFVSASRTVPIKLFFLYDDLYLSNGTRLLSVRSVKLSSRLGGLQGCATGLLSEQT